MRGSLGFTWCNGLCVCQLGLCVVGWPVRGRMGFVCVSTWVVRVRLACAWQNGLCVSTWVVRGMLGCTWCNGLLCVVSWVVQAGG